MLSLVRIAFFVAAAVSFVMAVLPHPPQLPGAPSDKVMHVIAFTILGGLGALAFPHRSIVLISALICFGAVIEMAQAIPALHRDSELADLIADSVAALISVGIVRIAKFRIPD